MKIYIDFLNNETKVIDSNDLKEFMIFGKDWLGLKYKNNTEEFIPNSQIAGVRRDLKK